jgi:hypothetical protein
MVPSCSTCRHIGVSWCHVALLSHMLQTSRPTARRLTAAQSHLERSQSLPKSRFHAGSSYQHCEPKSLQLNVPLDAEGLQPAYIPQRESTSSVVLVYTLKPGIDKTGVFLQFTRPLSLY